MTKIQTFTELLKHYDIEIPIIQRDYAQGRKDDHAKLVRSNLLVDMKAAILGKTVPLDLNFVYGKAIDDKFIPLDGQQRLTTLFLLHLFAFRNDDSYTETLHKFTYQTRKSSSDFFEALVNNRNMVFASKLTVSDEIKDSTWFITEWGNDPTVQSTLVVLDDIVDKFSDVDHLAELLVQTDDKPLTFEFLEMDDLGMEDSLYIKLNARGRALTPLENFKARLFSQIEAVDEPISDEFKRLFDNEWTDLFWKAFKSDFDDAFLRFFQVLFLNNDIIETTNNWANQFDFHKLEKQIFDDIFNILNAAKAGEKTDSLKKLIMAGVAKDSSYYDRLLFHAVTIYIRESRGKVQDSFSEWIRVAHNLVVNSQIDDSRTNSAAIQGLNDLVKHYDSIIHYLATADRPKGFFGEQADEELVKARILNEAAQYTELIHQAEANAYFTGTIRPGLYFAVQNGDFNADIFKEYWDKVTWLFDDDKPKFEDLTRQALLTYDDYTLSVGSYKTLCVNDAKESGSTPSIKRLFADHQDKVKGLLDDLKLTGNLENQLRKIIASSRIQQNDWRYCFITYPQIFSHMSKARLRLRFTENTILVVSRAATTGYNTDLYLTALDEKLKTLGIHSEQLAESQGTNARIFLNVFDGYRVCSKNRKLTVIVENDEHEFFGDTMLDDTADYLKAVQSV